MCFAARVVCEREQDVNAVGCVERTQVYRGVILSERSVIGRLISETTYFDSVNAIIS